MKSIEELENENIAKRFRFCRRNLIDKSIADLSKNHPFSYSTLTKWETGDLPITPKNVHKIIRMLNAEGVTCSKEWLLYGSGTGPSSTQKEKNIISFINLTSDPSDITEQIRIFNEVEFFKRNNPHSIIKVINDDAMTPFYKIGDYVGGIRIEPKFFHLINQECCIVKFSAHTYYVRQFFKIEKQFILMPFQPTEKFPPLILNNQDFDLYIISYHRKDFSHIACESEDDTLLKV